MRRIVLITATVLLGAASTACDQLPFGGGSPTTEQPVTEQSPVAVSPVPAEPSPAPQPFPQPTVEAQPSPQGILPPDLISSTDPNQRVQQVQGNRADPFALLPTTPTVQRTADDTQTAAAPTATSPTTAQSPPNQPRPTAQPPGTRPTTPNGQGGTGQLAPIPELVPRRSPIAAAPPQPQPDLARAVQVTGVVQVGDTAYAIVDAPNEPSSRYVQVGQRLSNGQVLVRRIEMNRPEPVVVLEQNGIEVVRAVGEGAPVAAPTTPAAFTPATGPSS